MAEVKPPISISDLISTDVWKSASPEERAVATQNYRKQAFDYLSTLEGDTDVYFEVEDKIAEKLQPNYQSSGFFDLFSKGVERVADIPELSKINRTKSLIDSEAAIQTQNRQILDFIEENPGEIPQGFSDVDIRNAKKSQSLSDVRSSDLRNQLTEQLRGFANNQILLDKKNAESGESRSQQLWKALPDGDASVIKDFLLSKDGAIFVYENSIQNAPQAVVQMATALINPIAGGASGGVFEFYGGITQRAQEEVALRGLDPKDPDSLLSVLSDDEFMKKAESAAAKKAGVITAIDAASFKLGGLIASKLAKGTVGGVVGSAFAGQALDVASGGLGEGLGQVAAGDPFSEKGVAEEMSAVGPQTATSTAQALGQTYQIRSQNKADDASVIDAVESASDTEVASFNGAKVTVFGGKNDPGDTGVNDKGERTGPGGREGVSLPKRVQMRLFGNNFKGNRENFAVSILDKDGNQKLYDIVDHGPSEAVIREAERMVIDVTQGVATDLGIGVNYKDGKIVGNQPTDISFTVVDKRTLKPVDAQLTETTDPAEASPTGAPAATVQESDTTAPTPQSYILPSGEVNESAVRAKSLLDTFTAIQSSAIENSNGKNNQRNVNRFKSNVEAARAILDRANKGEDVSKEIKELRKKANSSTLVKSKRVASVDSRVKKQLDEIAAYIKDQEKSRPAKPAEVAPPRQPRKDIDHVVNSQVAPLIQKHGVTIDTDIEAEMDRLEFMSNDANLSPEVQGEALDKLSDFMILSAVAPSKLRSILAGSDQSQRARDLANKQHEALLRYSDERESRAKRGLPFGGGVAYPTPLDATEANASVDRQLEGLNQRTPFRRVGADLAEKGALVSARKEFQNRERIADEGQAYNSLIDEFTQLTESLRNMMGTDAAPSQSEVAEIREAFEEAFVSHLPDVNDPALFMAAINASLPAIQPKGPAPLPSLNSIRSAIEASVKPPANLLNRLANAVLDFLRKVYNRVFPGGESVSIINPFKIKRQNAAIAAKSSPPWLKFVKTPNNTYAPDLLGIDDVLLRANTRTGLSASAPFRLADRLGNNPLTRGVSKFVLKLGDGRTSASMDDAVFVGSLAYVQTVDETLSKSNILNSRLDSTRKEYYNVMGYSDVTGMFDNLRARNPNLPSYAPSDVIESYIRDPLSVQLTARQKELIDIRVDAVREITNIAVNRGINIDPKDGTVRFTGAEPYSPRGSAVKDTSRGLNTAQALAASRNKKRRKPRRKGFQEDRDFATEAEGVAAGYNYADPDSRIVNYYKDMGRQHAERMFYSISGAHGVTHAEIEARVKKQVDEEIASGSLQASDRGAAISAGMKSTLSGMSKQENITPGVTTYISNDQSVKIANAMKHFTENKVIRNITSDIKTIGSLSFSYDVGYLGIQVTGAAGYNPLKWAKAFQASIYALGHKEAALKMIEKDPRLSNAMAQLTDGGYSIGEFIDEARRRTSNDPLFPGQGETGISRKVKTAKKYTGGAKLDSAFASTMDILAAMNAADQIDRDNLKGIDTSSASYKKQLADGISRMGGRGISSVKSDPLNNATSLGGALLFFASRYYRSAMESLSLLAMATSPVEQSLARRTLINFGASAGIFVTAAMLRAGVDDPEEWKERLFNIHSNKWLRVPFTGEDGITREISYGHILKPALQTLASMLPSAKESFSDAMLKLVKNRKSVPLQTLFELFGEDEFKTIGTKNGPHLAWILASKILPIPARGVIEAQPEFQMFLGREPEFAFRDAKLKGTNATEIALTSMIGLNEYVPSLSSQIVAKTNKDAMERYGKPYSQLEPIVRVALSAKNQRKMVEDFEKQPYEGTSEAYISREVADFNDKEKEFLSAELQLTEKLYFGRTPKVYDLGEKTVTGLPKGTFHHLTDAELKEGKKIYINEIKSAIKRLNYKVPEQMTEDVFKKQLIELATAHTIRALGYKPKPKK